MNRVVNCCIWLLAAGLLLLAGAGCHGGAGAKDPRAHKYTPEEIRAIYMQHIRSSGPRPAPGPGSPMNRAGARPGN